MSVAFTKFRTIDRTIQRCGSATRPAGLVASNDNLNRLTAGRPRLAARWSRNPGSGRLECRWSLEPFDGVSAEDPEPSGPAALPVGHTRVIVFELGVRRGRAVIQSSHSSMLFGN
jgi:hypothetical protein